MLSHLVSMVLGLQLGVINMRQTLYQLCYIPLERSLAFS